jgi:hypothetical protein
MFKLRPSEDGDYPNSANSPEGSQIDVSHPPTNARDFQGAIKFWEDVKKLNYLMGGYECSKKLTGGLDIDVPMPYV